jgi:D-glutamate cyclase
MLSLQNRIACLQDIIGTDAGGRGMKALIVPGDLFRAATIFVHLSLRGKQGRSCHHHLRPSQRCLGILSGFPCCMDHTPPTETDGPAGAAAIGRAALALGYTRVVVVTDDCNYDVFRAACEGTDILVESFPSKFAGPDEERFSALAQSLSLLVACERAGPAQDGSCYTMRGIDMTVRGLIAPLHRLVYECNNVPFLAIGDGGNELGMGKVYDMVKASINNGELIGCVVRADHLIAASVSNWGGYALAGAAALVKAGDETNANDSAAKEWVRRCLPTEAEEIALLNRCVAVGCRDGVTGKMEATVDGMPVETSLQCLRDVYRVCTTD